MRNNTKDADGKGFPLKITAVQVKVVESAEAGEIGAREIDFVKHILPNLEWAALVQAATEMGIPSLPPTLTENLVDDPSFLTALYHVLMNVHLIKGMLTCPTTGREFPVIDGVPNMMIEEEECEKVKL